MAEHVTALLRRGPGRGAAHDLLAEASAAAMAEGRTLGDALLDRLGAALPGRGHAGAGHAALDPAGYLGAAAEFVDAALTAHARAAG